MKIRIQKWEPESAKDLLKERLAAVVEYRKGNFENQWKENEALLFQKDSGGGPTLSYSSMSEIYQAKADQSSGKINVPRVAQNLRFLHSQMSANPPAVIPKATSNELSDRRSTDAANSLCSYARTHYKFHNNIDLGALSTLTYGTGVLKGWHDPLGGSKIIRQDSEFLEMEGDFKLRPMLIWDFWFDPAASVWEDAIYCFERKLLTMESALSMWHTQADELMASVVDNNVHPDKMNSSVVSQDGADPTQQLVEIFEYTEKGTPLNGMNGRRCFHLRDGTVLGELTDNPHPGKCLPYGLLTDIDVPGQVYGKTTVDYALGLAKVIDDLDNMLLDNIELHGSIKMVVFDQAETNEKNYSDNPVDIITVNGTHAHAPYQLKPAAVSSDVYALRAQMEAAIDGIMGVNELLQGQINREISGFASQTAINAANMVRHRLFNKYTSLVEFVYTLFLDSVRENWKIPKQIKVVGSEDASTLRYLSGSDISGGFLLSVEYGTNFSLDPAMRREEIMQAREVLLGAGITDKKIAKMLKYNEIDSLFDSAGVAGKRQMEIFERAIELYESTGKVEIEPAGKMKKAFHLDMAEAALEFVMSNDFLNLDEPLREAVYKHIDEREKLAAAQVAPPEGAPPGGPQAPPAGPQAGPMEQPPLPDIGGVL